MIFYVLFVHKKSVSKKKVCIIFIKYLKLKKTYLVVFFMCFFGWVFWVGFLLYCQPWKVEPVQPMVVVEEKKEEEVEPAKPPARRVDEFRPHAICKVCQVLMSPEFFRLKFVR